MAFLCRKTLFAIWSSSRSAWRTWLLDVELPLAHRALARADLDLGDGAGRALAGLLDRVGRAEEDLDPAVPGGPGVAEGAAVAELGHAHVEVELGQEVLGGERGRAPGVAHLVARLLELEARVERAAHERLHGLEVVLGLGQRRGLGLDGVVGGQGEEPAEALEGGGESGPRPDHGVARLRGLELRPEHVELAREADLEAGLGGLQQRLGALEALPRHVEELALGDDGVEGGRHLDREPLLREGERALLPLHRAPGVRELEEGRVRPDAAEEGLAEQEAQVGGLREGGVHRRLREVAAGGAHRAARPRERLGEVDAEDRPVARALEDRGDGREELAEGRLLHPARGVDGVHGVEEPEVALEGEAHGGGEAHRRRPLGRADDALGDVLLRGQGVLGRRRRLGRGRRLRREAAAPARRRLRPRRGRRTRRGGRFSRRDEVSGRRRTPSNRGFGGASLGD